MQKKENVSQNRLFGGIPVYLAEIKEGGDYYQVNIMLKMLGFPVLECPRLLLSLGRWTT